METKNNVERLARFVLSSMAHIVMSQKNDYIHFASIIKCIFSKPNYCIRKWGSQEDGTYADLLKNNQRYAELLHYKQERYNSENQLQKTLKL